MPVHVREAEQAARTPTRTAMAKHAAAWGASRAAAVAFVFLGSPLIRGDTHYYWLNAHSLVSGGAPIGGVMPEYPVPTVGVAALLAWLAQGSTAFAATLCAVLLLADGAFTLLLWRRGWANTGSPQAVRFWIVTGLLLAPLLCSRLDLLAAVTFAAALLLADSAPRSAGALLAVGSGLKFWPALGVPLVARARCGRRVLTSYAFAGTSIVLISSLGGLHRVTSPLTWQSGRGLQVESVLATPFMVAASADRHPWSISLSSYNAWEITGPGVQAALAASRVLVAVPVALTFLLFLRARRSPVLSETEIAWSAVGVVTCFVVCDKVFSPQYVVWISAAASALLAVAPHDPASQRLSRLLIAVAALTTLECPLMYAGVETAQVPAVVVLATRNALLLYVLAISLRRSITATATAAEF